MEELVPVMQSVSSLLSTYSVSFSDNSLVFVLFFMFLYCIVLYSHYSCSISNEKLNEHHAFESLGLLRAFTSLFK